MRKPKSTCIQPAMMLAPRCTQQTMGPDLPSAVSQAQCWRTGSSTAILHPRHVSHFSYLSDNFYHQRQVKALTESPKKELVGATHLSPNSFRGQLNMIAYYATEKVLWYCRPLLASETRFTTKYVRTSLRDSNGTPYGGDWEICSQVLRHIRRDARWPCPEDWGILGTNSQVIFEHAQSSRLQSALRDALGKPTVCVSEVTDADLKDIPGLQEDGVTHVSFTSKENPTIKVSGNLPVRWSPYQVDMELSIIHKVRPAQASRLPRHGGPARLSTVPSGV